MIRRTGLWGAVLLAACAQSTRPPEPDPDPPRRTAPWRDGRGDAGIPTAGGAGGGGVFGGGIGGGTGACQPQQDLVPPESPATQPPPLSGGTLAVLADGSLIAADPDRSRLSLISPDLSTVRSIALNADDQPGRIVDGMNGHAYVVLRRADQILDLEVSTATFTRLATCQHPRGLALKGAALIIGCVDGTLEQLDPSTGTRTRLPLDPAVTDLRDVVVDGERLLVSTFRSARLYRVDATGTAVPFETNDFNESIATPHVAWRAVKKTGGGAMMVRQLHSTETLSQSQPCVAAYGTGASGSPVVSSQLFTVGEDGAPAIGYRLQFGLPIDLAVSAQGNFVVLSANATAHFFGVTGSATHSIKDFNAAPVTGDALATGIAFLGEDIVMQLRDPAELAIFTSDGIPIQRIALGGEAVTNTGHTVFHRITPSELACASCHPEAGDDGHVWSFAEGPRRTPSLRGGLSGTEPFHWAGDLSNIDTLMQDVMVQRMGGFFESTRHTAALLGWLDAQPKLAAPVVDEAQAAVGKLVFERTCVSCHAGDQGTNNTTVSVGTGGAFQVPRLTGLAWRGPWFHDGRLTRLEDRFSSIAGGDEHGAVSTLSTDEKTALISYLRTR